jgi:hypothetical protein
VDITINRNRSQKGLRVEKILIGYFYSFLTTVTDYCDVHLVLDQHVQNQSVFALLLLLSYNGCGLLWKKGVKVEQILIGSERVGRVQGGHHNNP